MLPVETVKSSTHQQHGPLARSGIALATAAFATTMRVRIRLLNVSERMSIARRHKACVLVRAGSPPHRTRGGLTVTVTDLAPRDGSRRARPPRNGAEREHEGGRPSKTWPPAFP
jgi:hypothetical protein